MVSLCVCRPQTENSKRAEDFTVISAPINGYLETNTARLNKQVVFRLEACLATPYMSYQGLDTHCCRVPWT